MLVPRFNLLGPMIKMMILLPIESMHTTHGGSTKMPAGESKKTDAKAEMSLVATVLPRAPRAVAAVRQAEVKNADETSWKLAGALCWLWAAATAKVVAFVIHARAARPA